MNARDERASPIIVTARLAIFLARVADPLQIAGDAKRGNAFAQIGGHGLLACYGHNRALFDTSTQSIKKRVSCNCATGHVDVESEESIHRIREHFFSDAAHFGNAAPQGLQFMVKRLECMVAHSGIPIHITGYAFSRSDQ